MNKHKYIFVFILGLEIFTSFEARACEAICVITGSEFVENHIFTRSTRFYELLYTPYKVSSESISGLAKLCPSGWLVNSYTRVHVRPSLMGAGSFIEEGDYIRDVSTFPVDACLDTKTDETISK